MCLHVPPLAVGCDDVKRANHVVAGTRARLGSQAAGYQGRRGRLQEENLLEKLAPPVQLLDLEDLHVRRVHERDEHVEQDHICDHNPQQLCDSVKVGIVRIDREAEEQVHDLVHGSVCTHTTVHAQQQRHPRADEAGIRDEERQHIPLDHRVDHEHERAECCVRGGRGRFTRRKYEDTSAGMASAGQGCRTGRKLKRVEHEPNPREGAGQAEQHKVLGVDPLISEPPPPVREAHGKSRPR
eukprot:4698117-Prymnesium_polylepis.1